MSLKEQMAVLNKISIAFFILALVLCTGCSSGPPLDSTSDPADVAKYLAKEFKLEEVNLQTSEDGEGNFVGTVKHQGEQFPINVNVNADGITYEIPEKKSVSDDGAVAVIPGVRGGGTWPK